MNKVQVVDPPVESPKTAVFEYPVGFPDRVGRFGQMHVNALLKTASKELSGNGNS
jgi:hypothetical protein